MIAQFESAIVRIIRAADKAVVGTGFLVGKRQVLTCVHVVVQAACLSEDTSETSTTEVLLDFPLIALGRTLTARVVLWRAESDIAGMQLDGAPPTGARTVRLVMAEDLWGHSFRAFGFPAGYDDGVWASGVLRGRTGTGWVQIEDVKMPGYWVQPGFSGTPVWDDQLKGVVGMIVAADIDHVTKAAFVIPARELIEAWPELAEHSLEADSLKHVQMQLARLEEAQHKATVRGRFQLQIDALRERITTWDGRIERQRERIAEGLEAQRRQRAEEQARRREKMRLRVVGQPPLDVVDTFKDRKRDLAKLGRLLAEPTTRLVSVLGHGGMGKTALACKVLQDLERHRWPYTDKEVPADGIVYLSTRTAGISLERLFLDCAKLLGGERQERLNAVWTNPQLTTEEKIARLLEALSEGRYVILLDNLEDLLDDQGNLIDDVLRLFFEQGLRASHGAQLLVTSRVALAFRREVMRFDQQVKLLEGLPTDDGVALLRELDPNGDYGLRDAPEEKLAEVVELAHGVPRALEVMAGILANDPFASLDEVLETFHEQEDVVQALIEENYKRLDRNARRVIEALAVFRRPVPPLVVDYLLEPFAPGLDVPSVVRRLTRTPIVGVDRATKTVTLHPIDQDYAYSQLPEERDGELTYTRRALECRAADYYAQLRTPIETWRSIDDLEPQLAEFGHRVRAGGYDAACRVMELIDHDYLFLWGHYTRLIKMRERLLGRLDSPLLRISNLGSLGRAYHYLGQLERAIEFYEELLSIAREIGDRHNESVWLGYLGHTYRVLGQVERAVEIQRKALAIAREIDDRAEEGRHLGDLGLSYHALGEFEKATEFCHRALAIARETGKHRYQGTCLARLGLAYHALGQVKQAIRFYEEALLIAGEVGERRGEGIRLGRLAEVYYSLGQIELAAELHEQALTIGREIGHRWGESYQLMGLGKALLAVGKLDEAQRHCTRARDLDVPEISYRAALVLGIVLLHQHDPASGEAFADAAARCRFMLDKAANLYEPCYTLATALTGQAACDPRWAEQGERAELLVPLLAEYRRALDITAVPGVVGDALRDLELIRAAGIEGLEPVFELLGNV